MPSETSNFPEQQPMAAAEPTTPEPVVSPRRSLKNHTQALAKAQVGIGMGLAVGLMLFYLVGYAPAQKRQSALRMQIESKQRELARSRDEARRLPALSSEVGLLEKTIEKYDRQFPKQLELGQFIKDLTRLCQQASLQEWKYQPGAPRRTESLQEMPIMMQFNGDFTAAAEFIQQVEDLPRLTRVKRLRIKQRDARAGSVEVEAAVSIFFAEGR